MSGQNITSETLAPRLFQARSGYSTLQGLGHLESDTFGRFFLLQLTRGRSAYTLIPIFTCQGGAFKYHGLRHGEKFALVLRARVTLGFHFSCNHKKIGIQHPRTIEKDNFTRLCAMPPVTEWMKSTRTRARLEKRLQWAREFVILVEYLRSRLGSGFLRYQYHASISCGWKTCKRWPLDP